MCLLKRDQKDSNCGHAECKSYYMLNKQMCVHNGQPNQTPNNLLNSSNILLQSQDIPKSYQQPLMTGSLNIPQTLNGKRGPNVLENLNSDDKDLPILNKK